MTATTDVRERPIIFSGEMVRAILDGRKTQTRRVVQVRGRDLRLFTRPNGSGWLTEHQRDPLGLLVPSPYGYTGDRLWVRETWAIGLSVITSGVNAGAGFIPSYVRSEDVPWFAAQHENHKFSYPATDDYGEDPPRWRPSIFMPRFASRLTLEITNVRVERVQHIREPDAIAEGVTAPWMGSDRWDYKGPTDHREAFERLWNGLNARRGYGWDVNPLVWVIEFQQVAT
jgi:hypothetical protein